MRCGTDSGEGVIQVRDPRRAVVLPLLVVTWLVALQVLSFRGVAIWVVLGSLLCVYVVGGLFESGRIKIGLFVAAVLPVGVALLADVFGGSTSGPLARSTLIVCGLASVATAITFTRYRVLILPVMTVMFGAVLGLGSAQSVGVWVGVWVVAAGFTLVLLGPYRRTELRGRRTRSLAGVLISVGVIGVLGAFVASVFVGTAWTIPGQVEVDASQSVSAETPDPVSETASGDLVAEESALESVVNTIFNILAVLSLVLLFLLLLWLVYALVRRMVVRVRWWGTRRSMRSGAPRSRVIGSWEWTRLRLAQRGFTLPVSVSPDTAGEWARTHAEPELGSLSVLVAPIAFDKWAEPSIEVATEAWLRAQLADRLHVSRASWQTRWQWAGRGPGYAAHVLSGLKK